MDNLTFMVEGIGRSSQTFRQRTAGGPSEDACQRDFADTLSAWSDRVDLEQFSVHPRAFLGVLTAAGGMNLLAVILFYLGLFTGRDGWFITGAILCLLTFIAVLLEFGLFLPVLDPFFPRRTSTNLYACRRAGGDVQRRILFCGHADAAYEMNFLLEKRRRWGIPVALGAFAGSLYMLALYLARILLASAVVPWSLPGLALGAFAPAFIGILFFVNWRVVADGANDNLSGCYVAMAVLKSLSDRGIRFAHTEVGCLITGSEESGLRGARAFARRHRQLARDGQTLVIALDTLGEPDHMQLYTRGINGLQPNSPRACQLLRRAAARRKVKLPPAPLYPGATDAEAFSREGFDACALCAINHRGRSYYHTRHDHAGNIDPACLQTALDICLEAVYLFDREGLSH